MKKLLLLGAYGKMGTALREALAGKFEVTPKGSADFDAGDPESVKAVVGAAKPDVLVNAAAFLGIDPCEKEPLKALRLNALYPRLLAELAAETGFTLAHFSTDAVFSDEKNDFYTEDDAPAPVNLYGLTKYGGDCFIKAACPDHYIFRLPVLFGESPKNTQFVEKMLQLADGGAAELRVAGDIISSPTYSADAAAAAAGILAEGRPCGLYHLANSGKASLYDLMTAVAGELGLKTRISRASYRDFPYTGTKNTNTPMTSARGVKLRPWREAVGAYCARLKAKRDS